MVQILGLLGMYFDALVVEVKNFTQIGSGHTVCFILRPNVLPAPKIRSFTSSSDSYTETVAAFPVFLFYNKTLGKCFITKRYR